MATPDVAAGAALAEGTPPAAAPPSDGGWEATLPPELQNEPSVQLFKGKPVAEVVRSYVEAQKTMGSAIRLPKADAPPEERDKALGEVYNKLGRPPSPDKYELPKLPDGITFHDGAVKSFFTEAHKTGMTQGQAAFVLAHYANIVKQATAEQARLEAKAADEATAALKTQWGGDFDTKLVQAQRFTEQILGEPVYDLLRSKGLDNHPLIIAKFGELGARFGEGKMTPGDGGATLTPDMAREKILAIRADKNHPFHKGDKKAIDEMLELTRIELGETGRKIVATI